MGYLVLAFIIGTIFLAIVAVARSHSPKPDADAEATFARISQWDKETEVTAEAAAKQAAADIKKRFP